MKVIELLTEDVDIVTKIRQECQPFLRESKGSPAFRGIQSNDHIITVDQTPKNRTPRNSKKKWHKMIDNEMKRQFGHKFRSNSYFIVGHPEVAREYGDEYQVFPRGDIKYCWSHLIRDPVISFATHSDRVSVRLSIKAFFERNGLGTGWTGPDEKYAAMIVEHGGYKTTGLHEALEKFDNYEIMMWSSNGYYAVHRNANIDLSDL